MSESATSVRRLVIVHGTPGEELVQILQDSGLEAAVRSGDVTIWAPSPSFVEILPAKSLTASEDR